VTGSTNTRLRLALFLLLISLTFGCAVFSEPLTTAPPTPTPTAAAPASLALTPQVAEPTNTNSGHPTAPVAPTQPAPRYPDLSAGSFPASPVAYTIPLTIRHLMPEQASLFFELNAPAEGFLFYQQVSPQPAETRAAAIDPVQTRQMITLEGLSPGAEYLAVLGLGKGTSGFQQPTFSAAPWEALRFRTPDGREPLKVAVFSDASFGDASTEALVAQMAAQELDFAINAGDIVDKIEDNVNPVEAYAQKYFSIYSPLLHRMPIYTAIGNHDYDAEARWLDSYFYYYAFPAFPDPRFNETEADRARQYYAFAYNDVQFVMLDTQVFFGIPNWKEQDAWLAERLADPRFRFSIPVFHVPPFFSGSVHPDDQLAVRQFWHPLFAAARVPLVLSGHSHHYERLLVDGVTYIVTGGGSGTLYPAGAVLPQSQMFASRTHYILLHIYSDRIELSAIDKTGEQFDHALIPLQ
jgi:predicted phosphodiesterase